jgi:hypothetical protein
MNTTTHPLVRLCFTAAVSVFLFLTATGCSAFQFKGGSTETSSTLQRNTLFPPERSPTTRSVLIREFAPQELPNITVPETAQRVVVTTDTGLLGGKGDFVVVLDTLAMRGVVTKETRTEYDAPPSYRPGEQLTETRYTASTQPSAAGPGGTDFDPGDLNGRGGLRGGSFSVAQLENIWPRLISSLVCLGLAFLAFKFANWKIATAFLISGIVLTLLETSTLTLLVITGFIAVMGAGCVYYYKNFITEQSYTTELTEGFQSVKDVVITDPSDRERSNLVMGGGLSPKTKKRVASIKNSTV